MKVFVIAAITADGFIGRDDGHMADWTGSEDKKLFVRLTKEAGVIVMGSKTFKTIGRALPGRRNIVYTNNPTSITAPGIEATNETPKALIARLQQEGATAVAICGGASIYNLFMQAGLVDELYITVSPILFGQGMPMFVRKLQVQLQLLDTQALADGSVLLHYSTRQASS